MRIQKAFTVVAVMIALVLTVAGGVVAQAAPLPVENHYKTYLVTPNSTTTPVDVEDQFGFIKGVRPEAFDRFSTPTGKTIGGVVYPIIDPVVHMDWWRIAYPSHQHTIIVTDQFGQSTWVTGQPRYLLTPSVKDVRPPAQPPVWNHYLCYDVVKGPTYKNLVILDDQFGTLQTYVSTAVFFCNPAKKTAGGVIYPIIDPTAHLACYKIENRAVQQRAITTIDQFGYWATQIYESDCLCLPALKDEAVKTEQSTWGRVKALYRN